MSQQGSNGENTDTAEEQGYKLEMEQLVSDLEELRSSVVILKGLFAQIMGPREQ